MEKSHNIDYEKSQEYWAEIPPTVDGVLGGFGFISDLDIDASHIFLNSIISSRNLKSTRALDCGAGIGRVTKYLLIPNFEVVDAVESDDKFIKEVAQFVGKGRDKLGHLYNVGLQDFVPDMKYDVIWNQWVLGYLNDEHLVEYLKRCRNALSENGVIIVKENVTSSGKIEIDDTDSSVTRPLKQFQKIFTNSGLKRIKQSKQTNFPNGIYPVYMFALVPST